MKTKKQRIQEKRNNIKMRAFKKHNHYKVDCKGPRWRKRLAIYNDAYHIALATREIIKTLKDAEKLYKYIPMCTHTYGVMPTIYDNEDGTAYCIRCGCKFSVEDFGKGRKKFTDSNGNYVLSAEELYHMFGELGKEEPEARYVAPKRDNTLSNEQIEFLKSDKPAGTTFNGNPYKCIHLNDRAEITIEKQPDGTAQCSLCGKKFRYINLPNGGISMIPENGNFVELK